MKTLKTLTVVVLTVAALVAVPSAIKAQEKGAQKLLKPAVKQSAAAPSSTMACAKCTDKFVTVVDKSIRGANANQKSVVAVHGCGGCDTKSATVGFGKAAQNVQSHSCTMGGTGACCEKK